MVKKVIRKKKDNSDVSIKVKNVDKIIKEVKKTECKKSKCGSGFWIFGSALAMILSYERGASILWAIIHGILSWFYILFRTIQTWGWFS